MLIVRIPETRVRERSYIIDVVLQEFLGIEYTVIHERRDSVTLSLANDTSQHELVIDDSFLSIGADIWLQPDSLPLSPLARCDLKDFPFSTSVNQSSVPVLYGSLRGGSWCSSTSTGLDIGLDIFGGAFFMLTRYEEVVSKTRDHFGRFPASASIAFKEHFLTRPLVNEYVEILWGAISKLWPSLQRRHRSYRVLLSHDVDWPIMTLGVPGAQVLRSAVVDIWLRKDPALAARRIRSANRVSRGKFDTDIGNQFDFMMTTADRFGFESAYYFITDHTAGRMDGTYNIDDQWMRQLMRRIHERGHEIGLHTSFNTWRDPNQTRREFARLRSVCHDEGIEQETWGGRQHYLRWENPVTWNNWDAASLDYDSTLSFAEYAGFRSGVCYEYPVFDVVKGKKLNLRERPLIVMEATVFGTTSNVYMSLSDQEGLIEVERLNEQVRQYSGDFTLLWHNSNLVTRSQRRLYEQCLQCL